MNLGTSIKSLSSKFHLGLRISKSVVWNKTYDFNHFSAVCKPSQVTESSSNLIPYKFDTKELDLLCFYKVQGEKFCSVIPKSEIASIKSIKEPEKPVKVEIPLINVTNKEVDLPCIVERDLVEPTNHIISKKAINMLRVRARKMRIHKFKKFLKKMRAEFAKKKQRKHMQKEMVFQTELKKILKEKEQFKAENYLKEILDKINWVPPVTKARRRLAPKWVIEEELERLQEKKMVQERIEECIRQQK